MRVNLDLDSGIVSLPLDNFRQVDPLRVALTDASLEVRLMRTGALAQLVSDVVNPATIEFVGCKPSDFTPLVRGLYTQTGAVGNDPAQFPIYRCGEDWSAAALVTLFGTPPKNYVDIVGQFRWHNSNDPTGRYYYSKRFNVTVFGGLYTSGVVPGAVVLVDMLYISTITRLSGGVYPTDLDSIDISPLADKTMIRVAIAGRGESSWRRDTDAASPVTDLDAGTIVPTNYDHVARPYVLHRQSGY